MKTVNRRIVDLMPSNLGQCRMFQVLIASVLVFFFATSFAGRKPLRVAEAFGVTIKYLVSKPTLKIRSIRLAKEDPGSDILEKLPVVDELGQWIPMKWLGSGVSVSAGNDGLPATDITVQCRALKKNH